MQRVSCPHPQSRQILQPAHEWPPSSSMATRIALTLGNFTNCQLGTNQASSVALCHLGKHRRDSLFPRRGVMEWLPLALPAVSTHVVREFPVVAHPGDHSCEVSLSTLNCRKVGDSFTVQVPPSKDTGQSYIWAWSLASQVGSTCSPNVLL